MAVRFVVGRAGAGKTWRCLEAIRAALGVSATDGPRLLLIVPEQASFQMERALIETPGLAGYTRCEVLSFQRLAFRVFAETGADPRRGDQTIGHLGRLMVLRRLIAAQRGHLRLFGQVAGKPGLLRQLAGSIDELMREDVAPETLAALVERYEEEHPLAAAKLADLARVYQAYLDYLIDDRLDPAQYLTLATARMGPCGWLDGAHVWVDGFAGFTHQELQVLVALARRAGSMEIALLMDSAASVIDRKQIEGMSFSLFARTERTLVRLHEAMTAGGVAMDETVRLGGAGEPGLRFARAELGQIEKHLFRSVPSKPVRNAPDVVTVTEWPDRRAEVDAAVEEILRLTRTAEPAMRYRDIAVIVRDLGAYHDLLSAAMASHGIPCFIDRREPTEHHPLIELVRSLLATACDDCRLETVRLMLKTGLLPITSEEGDRLENYLLACGIAGRRRWSQPWSYTRIFGQRDSSKALADWEQAWLEQVNATRREWLQVVGPWLEATEQGGPREGAVWARSLYAALEGMNVGERLAGWAQACEADGRADEAQLHQQVWTDFVELLDEFDKALGREPMTVETFRDTLEAGLSEFDLGLAPATLDQVLVGAIERSRHPAVRAVLLLGFDQNHFPLRRSEDPVLGDEEREALRAVGSEVGPSRRRQLLDERMLAYVALTRASDRLWISYPRTEADGSAVLASPFLEDLQAALPGAEVQAMGDPRAGRTIRGITTPAVLGGRLADELRYRAALEAEDDRDRRALWNALYDAARSRDEWRATLQRTLSGLAYRNDARLEPPVIDGLVKLPFRTSVSRLERFAACPFAHFADYTLRLEQRVEAGLAEFEVGTLCHAILERFIDALAAQGRSLGELSDDEVAEQVQAATDATVPLLEDVMLLAEARYAYLCDRSRGSMARVARWQRDAARCGRFRPWKVEFPFGYADEPGATVQLTTPRGRTIILRGNIDRVDLAEVGETYLGVVIDYKTTTDRKIDYAKVFHGLSLQLVGYLIALQQAGASLTGRPIAPVAALYLPLLEPFKNVSRPDEDKPKPYQWEGVLDVGHLDAIDTSARDAGSSAFYAAKLKKDGEPYANSDLASADQIRALMQHVGRRMGELADGIIEGDISVAPYRLRRQTPCSFCPYRALCRYEIENEPPRTLSVLKKPEVLTAVAAREGE